MADRYVYSGAGGTGSGADWTNAHTTLAAAGTASAAGDRVFVAHDHAESTAGAVTITMAGTAASPNLVLCVNRSGSVPPVSADLMTGAVCTTTGANGITITAACSYWYGIAFDCGTGASTAHLVLSNNAGGSGHEMVYENCDFSLLNTSAASRIDIGTDGNGTGVWHANNCRFGFSNASQYINPNGAIFYVRGGGKSSRAATTPTSGFFGKNAAKRHFIDGFDFSGFAATVNLVREGGGLTWVALRNCKLPASWSGSLLNTAITTKSGSRVEGWNLDNGDTNYKVRVEDWTGILTQETTNVKSGGATDGDTPLAWSVATDADVEFPSIVFRCPEIFTERITSVGSAVTVTVDILHDNATALTDKEAWIEVEYLGTSGFPLSLFAKDSAADVLATAVAQTSSSATWTTTGMTNPNAQQLSANFTPQEEGIAIVTVCLAKASYTVKIDPHAQLSSATGTKLSIQIPGHGQLNYIEPAAVAAGSGGQIQGANLRGNFQ